MDNSAGPGYHRGVDCGEYRKDIDAFLSGDITDGRNSALVSHLASCEACREHLKERRASRVTGPAPGTSAGTGAGTAPAPPGAPERRPERKIASLNPVFFAGILAVLLVGVMVAMKVRDTTHDFLDKRFWNVRAEARDEPARGPDEKEIEEILRRLAKDLSAPREAPSEASPAEDLEAGAKCLDSGNLPCATERLRKATIGGRGTPQGDEARFQLIRAYTREKRCVEAMLHLAALAQDSPKSPRLGEAHMQNGECYSAQGQKGEAEQVYKMVALRFPDLREKAMAALAGLGDKKAK